MKKISSKQVLKRVLVAALALGATAACSSESATQSGTPEPASPGSLPACSWSADLDSADAETGACHAARTFLSCEGTDGSTEACMSDNTESCPDAGLEPVEYSSCVNQCHADEYAVSCGHVGPGQATEPPANCRSLPPNPGGVTFACCPCG